MTQKIILASKSASRRMLLEGAGIPFEARGSGVDEDVIKAEKLAQGTSPADIALALAEAKALACTEGAEDALVIGGDQVLEFDGQLFDKPQNMTEAADRLFAMAGRAHHLRAGLVLAQRGEVVWRHRGSSTLTMRPLTREEIDAYLAKVGERVLATVGAYELEGPGVRLFEAIEGDYFTILGLPLLPLIGALRDQGALPW